MKVGSRNLKSLAAALFRDESGQSTTEYVLLLLFVVIAVKQVGGQLKDRLQTIMNAAFGKATDAVNNTQE